MKRLAAFTALVFLVTLFAPLVAMAQEDNMRLYMVPSEVYAPGYDTIYYGPLYFEWRFGTGTLDAMGQRHYGFVDGYIVLADLSASDHDWLVVQDGVFDFPVTSGLDDAISPTDASEIQSIFEEFNLPTDWLTPANTYRELIQQTNGLFSFAKRFAVVAGELSYPPTYLFDEITLDTRYRDFPAHVKAIFDGTIVSWGYDPSDIAKPNYTVRQMLKQASDYIKTPLELAGYSF